MTTKKGRKKKTPGFRTVVIAICGTHGAAKTTLIWALSEILQKCGLRVRVVHETSGEARAYGFEINQDTTPDSQEWILHHLFGNLLFFVRSGAYDVIITDRHVDNAAYARLNLGKDGESHVMIALAHLRNRRYDLFVFVPRGQQGCLVANGTRAVSGSKRTRPRAIKFQSGAEREIIRLFRELGRKTRQSKMPFVYEFLPEPGNLGPDVRPKIYLETRKQVQVAHILQRIMPLLRKRFPEMTQPHLNGHA